MNCSAYISGNNLIIMNCSAHISGNSPGPMKSEWFGSLISFKI
jgi:hypothetical protein